MEKKLKVMAARAESAPTSTSASLVAAHWLVRKQKPTNHRKVQRAGKKAGRARSAPWWRQGLLGDPGGAPPCWQGGGGGPGQGSPRSIQEYKGH